MKISVALSAVSGWDSVIVVVPLESETLEIVSGVDRPEKPPSMFSSVTIVPGTS